MLSKTRLHVFIQFGAVLAVIAFYRGGQLAQVDNLCAAM